MSTKKKLDTVTEKPELSFYHNDNSYIILPVDTEFKLDNGINKIRDYIKNNVGLGQPENEKDILYSDAQGLWKEYQTELRNSKFSFYLNRAQYNFLTSLLLTKMEYDVNTVFIAIELTEMLANMKTTLKYTNDDDLNFIKVDATQITYVYHLISTHKVKGLTRDAYTFSEILRRIGQISKIVVYYDNNAKTLNKEIADWVVTFEDPNQAPNFGMMNINGSDMIEENNKVLETK